MRKVLRESFFKRDTKIVAEELLGKFLIRKITGKEISAMITETEAYNGPYDLASHASKGRTLRTEIMFGNPGNFYVYLCYGMYFMLNVVTREYDYPAAVLIRGVELNDHLIRLRKSKAKLATGQVKKEITREKVYLDGPGKITKFFHINQSLNGKIAKKSTNLWFEDRGIEISKFKIKKLPRIGVNYAGPLWSSKKLRFTLEV